MSEDEREGKPRGFESPYQQFLWKELSIIREQEREGNFYQALLYAISLLKYISPTVRNQLEKDGEDATAKIKYVVRQARKTGIWYNDQILMNRAAEHFGRLYLSQFMTALSDQLGERLYMEKRGRKVFQGKFEG